MALGEKIKTARKMRKLTQKQLGFLLGLPDVRVRQYEIDIRNPKETQMKSIADALGVPIEFFRTHQVETYIDVMHTLFDLETKHNLDVIEIDNNGQKQYALTFNDNALNSYLELWYKEINQAKVALNTNDKKVVCADSKYSNWKTLFPRSIIKKL